MHNHPNVLLAIKWGPSNLKFSWSLSTVDDLAKCSRTTGVSPLVSLRTQRMNLRNNSLQKWRELVYTADTQPSTNRMSTPYPQPNRDPPYWLSLPRNLQVHTCQLMSGHAITQKFLSVIDKENFEPLCPFNDGVG